MASQSQQREQNMSIKVPFTLPGSPGTFQVKSLARPDGFGTQVVTSDLLFKIAGLEDLFRVVINYDDYKNQAYARLQIMGSDRKWSTVKDINPHDVFNHSPYSPSRDLVAKGRMDDEYYEMYRDFMELAADCFLD